MNEPIYDISNIPLSRPSIVYNALKYIDQRPLLSLINHTSPQPRARLMPVAELAIELGVIQAVKARVPAHDVLTFVNLDTFPGEFDGFIEKVKNREVEIEVADIQRLLKQSKKNTPKNYKRSLLRYAASNRWFLPVLERFFCKDLDDFFRVAYASPFRPGQIIEEILDLLNLLASTQPKNILEIGTDKGGTLYLFTKVVHPAATLVSVDLRLTRANLFSSFARNQQTVTLIEGDSTAPATLEKIRHIFPDGLDFLFIDGDHSYTGVKQDFRNYSMLVRPGGLVAFHDIVEDNETRYGVVTGGWSGGVPRFWQEIKKEYRHTEFVKNYQQGGLGLGVLFIPDVVED
jgi:predicted O-methyltransferase YrrM